MERRLDKDGTAYTHADFVMFYGTSGCLQSRIHSPQPQNPGMFAHGLSRASAPPRPASAPLSCPPPNCPPPPLAASLPVPRCSLAPSAPLGGTEEWDAAPYVDGGEVDPFGRSAAADDADGVRFAPARLDELSANQSTQAVAVGAPWKRGGRRPRRPREGKVANADGLQRVECPWCFEYLTASDFREHQETKCEGRIIKCRFPFCTATFRAEDQRMHEQHYCQARRSRR